MPVLLEPTIVLEPTSVRAQEPHREALAIRVLDVNISIRCADASLKRLLTLHYGALPRHAGPPDLRYAIDDRDGSFRLTCDRDEPLRAVDRGELLLLLDQHVIVELQRRRPDVYFVHAGVLELDGRACLLVAPSGGGKSTTVWGLVHHGLRYLSDELAPIELSSRLVHPYPRALTLKSRPPAPYPLPCGTLATSRGFHIAPNAVAAASASTATPIAALLFLQYVPEAPAPSMTPMGAAQAAARLYANTLNPLAHAHDGLDAAIAVVRSTACFLVSTADLAATCALVKRALTRLPAA
jgi:hypothetical protein